MRFKVENMQILFSFIHWCFPHLSILWLQANFKFLFVSVKCLQFLATWSPGTNGRSFNWGIVSLKWRRRLAIAFRWITSRLQNLWCSSTRAFRWLLKTRICIRWVLWSRKATTIIRSKQLWNSGSKRDAASNLANIWVSYFCLIYTYLINCNFSYGLRFRWTWQKMRLRFATRQRVQILQRLLQGKSQRVNVLRTEVSNTRQDTTSIGQRNSWTD